MATLKRTIYGLPIMAPYRAYRTRQLARDYRDHPWGFRFAGSPSFFSPEWEVAESAAVFDGIAHSEVFIDIGANQGVYTCLAAQQGKTVAAVEPEPGNLRFLLGNLRENGFSAEVYPLALSDAPHTVSIYGDGDTASLVPGWMNNDRRFATLVPSNSLDNLFGARWLDRQIFIKLDVEGHELSVLQGAQDLLGRARKPTWLIEAVMKDWFLPDAPISADFLPLFEMMSAAGYSCRPVEQRDLVSLDDVRNWVAGRETPPSNSNFLFAPA